MSRELASPNWSGSLQSQAHLLHAQIAAMQRLVFEAGGGEEMLQKSCASYYRLLDELYEKEMPIARALDRSDFLLHLDGEGLQTRHPRLSLVTSIMSDVRKQVSTMIRTLVSSFHEGVELPHEIDLGLSSFAQGSLYLGFSLPEPPPGRMALPDDPLFAASRHALLTLGAMTERVNEPHGYELICQEFPDPKLRDAALSAVGQLAPSGRRGVTRMAIGGRALPPGAWPTLTPATRQQIRGWLEQPVLGEASIELRGRVRSIDLDLRRFDLRRIDDGQQPDLRCIYSASFDVPAKKWLDKIVMVRGRVETYHGVARLLQVQTVEERP